MGEVMASEVTTQRDSNRSDRDLSDNFAFGVDPFHDSPVEKAARTQKVIVAIPAYNEEVAIGSVVLRARQHADDVIVIDDGSKDRTADVARFAGATIIQHLKNEGKGAAIRDAFLYARTNNADVLVLIDGDGQHNPDEIPQLVGPILNKEADLVNGSRFLKDANRNGNGNHVPKYRRVGQEVLTLATNTGTKQHITDTQNGFRAFSRKTFSCFSFKQNGMAIESEMLMDAAGANMTIKEVPIDVRYDVKGSTYNPVTHGTSVLGKVIGLVAERRPMMFFCVPGALLMSIGTICVFMFMTIFNETHNLHIEYGIGAALFIILGMLFISTGLMLSAIQNIKRTT
jgi:hypothetical protein